MTEQNDWMVDYRLCDSCLLNLYDGFDEKTRVTLAAISKRRYGITQSELHRETSVGLHGIRLSVAALTAAQFICGDKRYKLTKNARRAFQLLLKRRGNNGNKN